MIVSGKFWAVPACFLSIARAVAIAMLVSLFLGTGAMAQAGNWQILTYPDPAPGVSKTFCFGVNGAGAMVGYYQAPAQRAYLFADGLYTSLHPAGATKSSAWGINARGDVVGDYWVDTQEHGFLLRNGQLVTIDLPGKTMAHPRDINARGDIAGYYMTTSDLQGFILARDGAFTEVRYPNAVNTYVYGISDEGGVAGEYVDSQGGWHGFFRSKAGDFTSLDYPNASSTSAWKVNAGGEVAGYYYDSETPSISHGFVWRNGVFQKSDYPGATQTMIHGLNGQGETCGMMSFSAPTTSPQWGGFADAW